MAVSFFDISVWRPISMIAILLGSLLLAQVIKTKCFLKKFLIPNSVIGGILILLASVICRAITGKYLFNLEFFSGDGSGMSVLEQLTYHCLAVGFIAMTLREGRKNKDKGRVKEIIGSSILTINGYLAQAIVGITVTILMAVFVGNVVPGSGALLCFGFGQGTGQAMTQGANFDAAAMTGEKYLNLGLSFAAFGFLIASLGGVVVLNSLKRKGLLRTRKVLAAKNEMQAEQELFREELYENESIDKLSIQGSLVFLSYFAAYGIMYLLGKAAGGMIGTVYGFNFLFGVLAAVIVKKILALLNNKGLLKKKYANDYLLNRISGFAFDLMIVSGIAAIQIHLLYDVAFVLILLVILGTIVTF